MPAPSAISRIALKAATMNDDISARKKFIAPVTVPICARATEFCSETTLTGNVVPSPSANSDSTTSSPHSGSVVTRQHHAEDRRRGRADDGDALVVFGARHGPSGDRRATGRNRRERDQRQPRFAGAEMIDDLVIERQMHGQRR